MAYGAGPLIQLLLGSGAHNYLEFKLVQGRWGGGPRGAGVAMLLGGVYAGTGVCGACRKQGLLLGPLADLIALLWCCSYLVDLDASASSSGAVELRSVPSSRSEVFKDRQLSPVQVRFAGCLGYVEWALPYRRHAGMSFWLHDVVPA